MTVTTAMTTATTATSAAASTAAFRSFRGVPFARIPMTKDAHTLERYPADLIDVWHGRRGGRFTLRPVLPQDHAPLGELVRRLSPATRRARFHASIATLSDAALQAM